MARSESATKPGEHSVADFIATIADERRRADAAEIDAIMRRVSGHQPTMWGPSIIGYGSYSYRYESGREGTMCRIGFSPRKAELVIYAMGSVSEAEAGQALLAQLGKHKTGKGCLYVRKLADVDLAVLEELVSLSWQVMNANYPE
jgi:hypothetical protein